MAKKGKTGKNKKAPEKKRGIKTVPMIIIGLILAFFLQSSFILLLIGLLPSIVAYFADTSKGRTTFRIVMACNLAGVLQFLTELVMQHNSASLLLQRLTDPSVWLVMYLSAAVGYILIRGMPFIVEFCYEMSNAARIARIQSLQNRLIEEWGPEIQRSK